MSLCRFLPIPSDRMGILWSLLTIKDSIILEYGPAGTTHYAVEFFSELNLEQQNRIFTTHMTEDDVVMGDVSRLEAGILEVCETYNPSIIFVVASSVSSVIGTDMKGVCSYMQNEVSAKLIPLEEGGFKGDYSAGEAQITKMIVKALAETSDIDENSYNILGASMNSYRMESDICEIRRMLDESFGFKLHTSLFYNTSSEEISTMSKAKFNLVISQTGLETAKYLEKKFGTPYIYMRPYGYKGTLAWLEQIAELTGKQIAPTIMGELRQKIMQTMHYGRMMMMFKAVRPSAYVYGDYDTAKGIGAFLADFGCPIKLECKHSLKGLESDDITYFPTEKERMTELATLNETFVLADDISHSLVNDTNFTLRITNPLLKGSVVATHLPFVGIRGADFIRENYDTYFASIR